MENLIKNSIQKSYTYKKYRDLVSELLKQEKSTGKIQSESLLTYSKLNDARMNRLDKKTYLSENTLMSLSSLKEKQTWLVLTEGWCGDAAHILPVMNAMSEQNDMLDLKVVLRDENEELMNQFLTNGNKSIPKLIVLNSENEVINSWGPRPSVATQMVNEYKEKNGSLDAEFKKGLQVWYNKNKGENIQENLTALL